MKTRLGILVFLFINLLSIHLVGQSWDTNGSNIYINPSTTKVGIGTSSFGDESFSILAPTISGNANTGKMALLAKQISTGDWFNGTLEGRFASAGNRYSTGSGFSVLGKITLNKSGGTNSYSTGGYFISDFSSYTSWGSGPTYAGGIISRMRGSITSMPSNGVIASIMAFDELNREDTWAGYFQGRSYFSDKVGINQSNPAEALDVNGNIRAQNIYLAGGKGIYSRYNSNYILNDHNNGNVTLSAAGGNLYLGYQNTGKVLLRKGLYDTSATYRLLHENGYIYQSKSGVDNYFAGNVGINITDPKAKLDVNGISIVRSRFQIGNSSMGWINDAITGYTNGLNASDGAVFVPVHKDAESDLRLYITDDANDAFSIWGGTCAGGSCGDLNSASQVVRFEGSGKVLFNGSVGIGKTPDSSVKLDVAGNVKAQEIEVSLASMDDLNLNGTLAANNITVKANGNTADFVFEETYNLRDLSELEAFIKENKHLPEIPSAEAMEAQGVNLAEMNKLLLQKVEELTLYTIELEKAKNKEQGEREKLESTVLTLSERLAKIEQLLNQ